uniref:Uncharacterized protein n=1 Tax=Arion vulgaris TaxID=1028688 RepID=A0A0B7AD64_9EUPU
MDSFCPHLESCLMLEKIIEYELYTFSTPIEMLQSNRKHKDKNSNPSSPASTKLKLS